MEQAPSTGTVLRRQEWNEEEALSLRTKAAKQNSVDNDGYKRYPLVHSMLLYEKKRTASLEHEGRCQMNYVQSNEGWIRTLFVVRGRALNWMVLPWSIAVIHAVIYTVVQEIVFEIQYREIESWDIFVSFVLNSTLAFLLVFRLNRAAGRYWIARAFWGDIVARSRSFVGGMIVHADHNRVRRDHVIRWVAAYAITTMEFLRGQRELPVDNFAGILTTEEVQQLEQNTHSPMYAADQIRYHLKETFRAERQTPPPVAHAWTQQLDTLEQQLNTMIWSGGGLERIRGTPLPIVYVSHLRTFIMINLILYPWVFGPSWGWSTIPIVALAAFAWLGIECAATECESPFRADRVNALNMDGFVIGLLSTMQQQLKNHADQDMERKKLVDEARDGTTT
jgi:putative membrane protein